MNELKYYTLYANAAYGIGLCTLSKPCAICCSPPCFLPYKMDRNNILYRNKKCCCDNIQLDNSNLKVFIERTNIPINDLLLIQQIGDLNKVNFYVSIDYNKQSLIISLRGSMSIQDSITDIQCQPMHFPQIHNNCYVHSGIGNCAKYVFDIIINNQKIIHFFKNNHLFSVILVSVCVLLSLMFKYGTKHKNLKYFINDKHKFKACELWNAKFCQCGFIFHIVNDNEKELNKNFEHKIDMNENDDIKNNLMRNETHESMECIKNICKTIWKSVVYIKK